MGPFEGGCRYLHYLHHSLASGQITGKEQPSPSPTTENWIKDLLSMALPIRTRPSFSLSQSLLSGSFHKPHILHYNFWITGASLVAQTVENSPAMQETQVQSLGSEVLLEKEMVTHSSILAWVARLGHDWASNTFTILTNDQLNCLVFSFIVKYMFIFRFWLKFLLYWWRFFKILYST